MPKIKQHAEEGSDKNATYKSARRQSQAVRAKRNQPVRASRQKQRNISVLAELRDKPDIRKVARAVVQHALAEAERESQRIAEMSAASQRTSLRPGDVNDDPDDSDNPGVGEGDRA